MEKIRVSEIMAMNPELSLKKIKQFGFFAVDMGGDKYLYENKPKYEDFRPDGVWNAPNGGILFVGHNTDWINSLREIDFTEAQLSKSQEVDTSKLIQVCRQFVNDFELGCVVDGSIIGDPAVALVDLYNEFKQLLENNEQ